MRPGASRCSKYRFRPLSADAMTGKLREICQAEEVSLGDDALEALEAEQKRWSSEHARPLPVGEVRARVSAHVRAAAAQR